MHNKPRQSNYARNIESSANIQQFYRDLSDLRSDLELMQEVVERLFEEIDAIEHFKPSNPNTVNISGGQVKQVKQSSEGRRAPRLGIEKLLAIVFVIGILIAISIIILQTR